MLALAARVSEPALCEGLGWGQAAGFPATVSPSASEAAHENSNYPSLALSGVDGKAAPAPRSQPALTGAPGQGSVFGAERRAQNPAPRKDKAVPRGEQGLGSHFTAALHFPLHLTFLLPAFDLCCSKQDGNQVPSSKQGLDASLHKTLAPRRVKACLGQMIDLCLCSYVLKTYSVISSPLEFVSFAGRY